MGDVEERAVRLEGPPRSTAARPLGVVAVIALVGALSSSARADELVDAAKGAINARQFCEARDLYVALHRRDKDTKYLYNAAESAAAADDRVSALALYQELLENDPGFARADKARERVTELGQLIAASGSGASCPARAARCGDTYLDAREMCDDGNQIDGDGCDRNCTPTSCGNGIVTAPETCDDGNIDDGDGCDATCGEPAGPISTAPDRPVVTDDEPFPVLPAVVTAGGAVVLVAGAVLAGLGGAGWLGLQSDKDAFAAASAAATDSPGDQGKLAAVVDARAKADASLAGWNGAGQLLWIGGVAGGVAGAGVVAAGIAWWAVGE